jgi:hypothetical protein
MSYSLHSGALRSSHMDPVPLQRKLPATTLALSSPPILRSPTLPVSGGPPWMIQEQAEKACGVGRPLQWLVRCCPHWQARVLP